MHWGMFTVLYLNERCENSNSRKLVFCEWLCCTRLFSNDSLFCCPGLGWIWHYSKYVNICINTDLTKAGCNCAKSQSTNKKKGWSRTNRSFCCLFSLDFCLVCPVTQTRKTKTELKWHSYLSNKQKATNIGTRKNNQNIEKIICLYSKNCYLIVWLLSFDNTALCKNWWNEMHVLSRI